jgi:phosphoribosyl 1,2-cyclic phosphate phosphodiesterase
MSLKATILGCGTSGGVPRIGNQWGACDPNNPKNRRRRCALLVEREGPGGTTRILVDTPPDLREQLIDAEVGILDGVLYTHEHADHCHGIDDLRMVCYNARRRVDVYHDAVTGRVLRERFAYCFETPEGSEYPAVLEGHEIPHLEGLDIWILDALRYTEHPSHLSVEQALAWIERLKPTRAVLTHMHVDLDYAALADELPDGVEPAYDGMVLTTA